MRVTEENVRELKMGTFEYIDNVLSTFQDKSTSMNDTYIQRMIADINDLFEKMNSTIDANRDEIKLCPTGPKQRWNKKDKYRRFKSPGISIHRRFFLSLRYFQFQRF